MFALGTEKLDKLMPDVIATTVKTELPPNVRDGYLMLYIYLPATFEDEFLDYIGPIIPAILKVTNILSKAFPNALWVKAVAGLIFL